MTVEELGLALAAYQDTDVVLGLAVGVECTWSAIEVEVLHDRADAHGMPVVVLREKPDFYRFVETKTGG